MLKTILTLLVGILIGSATVYFLTPNAENPRLASKVDRDIEYVPEISVAEAEAHREDRYASIKTIADTLALPTDFAETEALYVIAGREDTFGIHQLIEQAIDIREPSDRRAATSILLTRLTELDPYDALETARERPLGDNPIFEKAVWATWGRLNLEQALAIAQEGTRVEKNIAAQSLYASVRGLDEGKLSLIESTLGIGQDRDARAQRIYSLAANSPVQAIQYIESKGTTSEQREQITFLAYYLSRLGSDQAADYAELIQSKTNRRAFEQIMASSGVALNPEAALADLLKEPGNAQFQTRAYSALQHLARQDPDKAISYVENMSDPSTRKRFSALVAHSIASTDPQRALDWARQNITGREQDSTVAAIIGQIAVNDPQLALTEAQSISSARGRAQAMQTVIAVSVESDPATAASMLSLVTEADTRRGLVSQLAQTWGQKDFDAAVQWMASLDENDQRAAIQGMSQQYVHRDVDRAIALVDQFPGAASANLRAQIASGLAQQRSIGEAQSYISQYKGTAEYSRLQMSVLTIAAQKNPDQAMQMVDSIQEPRRRDQLIATIVSVKAAEDPRLALQWTETISDSAYREQSLGQIAAIWNQRDPEDAERWLQSLPRGGTRDSAILAISSGQPNPGSGSLDLINTIDDEAKRKQATLMLVQRLLYSQPAEAENILSTLELSDTERMQFQRMFDRTYYNNGGDMD